MQLPPKQQPPSKQLSPFFKLFMLKESNLQSLSIIEQPNQALKSEALIKGILCREQNHLYRSNKYFYEDLQLALEYDLQNSPAILKANNIVANKEHSSIQVQCRNCGKHTAVNKYCPNCENVHYCSEACEMQIKFTHEREQCKGLKPYPKLHQPLQVEVHFGSDYGGNIEVHYQHQMYMSLLQRGKRFIEGLFAYFTEGEGKPKLPKNYSIQLVQKHLLLKKNEESEFINDPQKVTIHTLEDLKKIYTKNALLPQLELYIMGHGGILRKQIEEVHNNHLHLIYIFNAL